MPLANPDLELLQSNATDSAAPQAEEGEALQTQDPAQQELQKQQEEADEDEIDRLLLCVIDELEKEDKDIRYGVLKNFRRNDLYFNNIMKIFYDATARDYRTIDSALAEMQKYAPADDIKTVNVYRAYAESLISALSVSTPGVEFTPDDADDPEDIQTADAYTKIAYIVEKHNESPLLLIKALTILFNQGVVAARNEYRKDPNFGIISTPGKTEPKASQVVDLRCQQCGNLIDSNLPPTVVAEQSSLTCPVCGYTGAPQAYAREVFVDEVVSYEQTPKGRSLFDVYGPCQVKMPLYAKNQDGLGYLELREEAHYAKYRAEFEKESDDADEELISEGDSDTEKYERWSRIPIEYSGTLPKEIVTKRSAWVRPWYFNVLAYDDATKLRKKYPDGVKIVVIGDEVLEKVHEKLDDYWTITFDPRSNFVHAEPPGNALVPLQDAKTDMFNLGLQSIEFGIPETFAHPKTLNFQTYGNTPAAAGNISPALPPGPDKSLADGFHTIKTATLSNEYISFDQGLDGLTQFVTGAFPSIFGGNSNAGSKTASEYKESRARALQRLQLTWQMISSFWGKVIFKCARDYAKNLKEDESYSQKQNGTWINVWVKKSGLQGKVGHINPEINEQLPQSWEQKKDFFMSLVTMQNPEVGKIVLHPANTELLKQVTGMPDFYIPGEHDRNKQYSEYYLLAQAPAMGNEPSVAIDIDVDDHLVHMLVLKNILVSPIGINLYQTQPEFYNNCIAHYRKHEMALQAKTISPAEGSPEGATPPTSADNAQG